MKQILALSIVITFVSCSNPQLNNDITETTCNDTWENYNPTEEELELNSKNGIIEKQSNDTTIQQILYGKVWFEIINQSQRENGKNSCYLKNYRIDGSIDSEGKCTFEEHPIADYSMDGTWTFYNCDGSVKEKVNYKNGKRTEI